MEAGWQELRQHTSCSSSSGRPGPPCRKHRPQPSQPPVLSRGSGRGRATQTEWRLVLPYLDAYSLLRLGQCCRAMRANCESEHLWKTLCGRHGVREPSAYSWRTSLIAVLRPYKEATPRQCGASMLSVESGLKLVQSAYHNSVAAGGAASAAPAAGALSATLLPAADASSEERQALKSLAEYEAQFLACSLRAIARRAEEVAVAELGAAEGGGGGGGDGDEAVVTADAAARTSGGGASCDTFAADVRRLRARADGRRCFAAFEAAVAARYCGAAGCSCFFEVELLARARPLSQVARKWAEFQGTFPLSAYYDVKEASEGRDGGSGSRATEPAAAASAQQQDVFRCLRCFVGSASVEALRNAR